jgi:hypothetical protein
VDDGAVCFPVPTAEISFGAFCPLATTASYFDGMNSLQESRGAQMRGKLNSVRETWRVSTLGDFPYLSNTDTRV